MGGLGAAGVGVVEGIGQTELRAGGVCMGPVCVQCGLRYSV